MSNAQWMPIYWGDYLRDTAHLSTAEHGAYLLIIGHYWCSGGAIPKDIHRLLSIARLSNKKNDKKMIEIVLQFFTEKNGLLYHNKLDKLLLEMSDNKEKNRKRTEAARAARASVTTSVTDIVTTSVTASTPPPPKNLLHKTHISREITPRAKAADSGGEFLENENGLVFDVTHFLNDDTLARARAKAPGWDVYYLASIYNQGVASRGVPRNPAAAFAEWCAKYTKGKPPA